tara:strand:- start:1502 stop:1675 length:174 start_codon:yes stop_codon:yes gene_type:complete
MNAKRQEEMERELNKALEDMDKALDEANGNCAKKIRSRTMKVKMSILSLLRSQDGEK